MKRKRVISFGVSVLVVLTVLLLPARTFAHIVVSPDTAGAGTFQTFIVSVPNERRTAVTGIRLIIPDGVMTVTPTVKAGWEITTKQSNDSIKEISWSGGIIPADRRDEFTFTAQAPAEATTLRWKAYQTYQNGDTVPWDQEPASSGSQDEVTAEKGPFSVTQVVTDIPDTDTDSSTTNGSSNAAGAYILAGLSLVLAIIALTKKR